MKPDARDRQWDVGEAGGVERRRSKCAQLDQAVLELLRGPRHAGSGEIPTSIRFLFYELEHAGVLDKRGRRSDLSEAVMRLRRAGIVPWGWIVDETRALDTWAYRDSIRAYALAAIQSGRIDCWEGEPPPLILAESRSLAGVLRPIASQYLCPVAATNGQVGGFLHTDIIPALRRGQQVLYFGDEDLSGHQIEQNTRRVIEGETGELAWERLALTPAQVRDHDLPAIQKLDRRYKPPRAGLAYETEALSQTIVKELLVSRLDELLPEPLADVQERERAQRRLVETWLR